MNDKILKIEKRRILFWKTLGGFFLDIRITLFNITLLFGFTYMISIKDIPEAPILMIVFLLFLILFLKEIYDSFYINLIYVITSETEINKNFIEKKIGIKYMNFFDKEEDNLQIDEKLSEIRLNMKEVKDKNLIKSIIKPRIKDSIINQSLTIISFLFLITVSSFIYFLILRNFSEVSYYPFIIFLFVVFLSYMIKFVIPPLSTYSEKTTESVAKITGKNISKFDLWSYFILIIPQIFILMCFVLEILPKGNVCEIISILFFNLVGIFSFFTKSQTFFKNTIVFNFNKNGRKRKKPN
jgi:hypothetical protein